MQINNCTAQKRAHTFPCLLIGRDVAPEERFLTKSEARSAVCYLAVLKMLEKGYIDERLNPTRTKDRLVVSDSIS